MISPKQLELSEQVKSVHLQLRRRAHEVGAERAWQEHLSNTRMLEGYANAMKALAEGHWSKNNQGDRREFCRIQWTLSAIREYFIDGGYENQIRKQLAKFKDDEELIPPCRAAYDYGNIIKLLDVGSCYNPFKEFNWLQTYALDLFPASADVMQCNFLDVEVCSEMTNSWWGKQVTSLPRDFFDVVVFSLFLEYLPCSKQRLKACEIAFSVLKDGGLLIIITPDSKHQTANARLMKSWKLALVGAGFTRVRIEKLRYLYCMSFRKTLCPLYRCLPQNIGWEQAVLSVPQDFVNYSSHSNDSSLKTLPLQSLEVAEAFCELPDIVID